MNKDTRLHDLFQKAVALLTLPIFALLIASKRAQGGTQEQSRFIQPWIYPWEEAAQFCLCVFFFAVCAIPTILRLKTKTGRFCTSSLPALSGYGLGAPFRRSPRAQRIARVLFLSILNDLWIGINIRSLCYAASDFGCVSTGVQTKACQVARSVQILSIFAGCVMILEIHFCCMSTRPVKEPVTLEKSEAGTGNIHPESRPPAPV